jgi:roadblock/LC7 domain-containing protein
MKTLNRHAFTIITVGIAVILIACVSMLAQDGSSKEGKPQLLQSELVTDGSTWLKVSIAEVSRLTSHGGDTGENILFHREIGKEESFFATTPSDPNAWTQVSPAKFRILEITWISGKTKDDLKDTPVNLHFKILGKGGKEIGVGILTSSNQNLVQIVVPKESVSDTIKLSIDGSGTTFPTFDLKFEKQPATEAVADTSRVRLLAVRRNGPDVEIEWRTTGGVTNVVQAAGRNDDPDFVDISGPIIIPDAGAMETNYVYQGAALRGGPLYFRIRLSQGQEGKADQTNAAPSGAMNSFRRDLGSTPRQSDLGSTNTAGAPKSTPSTGEKRTEQVAIQPIVKEQRLGSFNAADKVIRSETLQGCRIATVTKYYDSVADPVMGTLSHTRSKAFVSVDCQRGDEYDAVSNPLFSSDGTRVAYISAKAGKIVVVVDGHASSEYADAGLESLVFSADSKHFSYYALMEGKWSIVIDGQQIGLDEWIPQDSVVFSADGKRTAYVAQKGSRWKVVVDGRDGGEHDNIAQTPPVFSPNDKHVAYIAIDGGKCLMVVDEKVGVDYDGTTSPVFSADDEHMAFAAKKGAKWMVIADGQTGAEYDGIGNGSLAFNRSSNRLAYWAKQGDKWIAVVDGKSGPAYDDILKGPMLFSADGKHMAYGAKKGEKWLAVVDGRAGSEYDAIVNLRFSPDGKRVAYAAKIGSKLVVVADDKVSNEYETIGSTSPIFSSDSKHFAFTAQKGTNWLPVVDGQAGSEYDGISNLRFSPDAQHVTYGVRAGAKGRVLVDGKVIGEYDGIPCGPMFRSDGLIEFLATRGTDLYRITAESAAPSQGSSQKPAFSFPPGARIN